VCLWGLASGAGGAHTSQTFRLADNRLPSSCKFQRRAYFRRGRSNPIRSTNTSGRYGVTSIFPPGKSLSRFFISHATNMPGAPRTWVIQTDRALSRLVGNIPLKRHCRTDCGLCPDPIVPPVHAHISGQSFELCGRSQRALATNELWGCADFSPNECTGRSNQPKRVVPTTISRLIFGAPRAVQDCISDLFVI